MALKVRIIVEIVRCILIEQRLEWLRARGIIDAPLKEKERMGHESSKKKRKSSPIPLLDDREPSGSSVTKRLRTYDPAEVIDIDDLESDSDSDVVVLSDPIRTEVCYLLHWFGCSLNLASKFTTPHGLKKVMGRGGS